MDPKQLRFMRACFMNGWVNGYVTLLMEIQQRDLKDALREAQAIALNAFEDWGITRDELNVASRVMTESVEELGHEQD